MRSELPSAMRGAENSAPHPEAFMPSTEPGAPPLTYPLEKKGDIQTVCMYVCMYVGPRLGAVPGLTSQGVSNILWAGATPVAKTEPLAVALRLALQEEVRALRPLVEQLSAFNVQEMSNVMLSRAFISSARGPMRICHCQAF